MKLYVLTLLVSASVCNWAEARTPRDQAARLWLEQQVPKAFAKISENISPPDARRGAVIAARTRKEPNYYYHWVRDAGIVFEAYLENLPVRRAYVQSLVLQKARDYAHFSNHIQQLPAEELAIGGLGEAKYEVDGSYFLGEWSRPQNDGPAIRAISLISLVRALRAQGDYEFIQNYLYRADMPASTVIKRDLEYISHHWRDTNYDLWEEVRGDHFYTRMVQLRALREGSALAQEFGDPAAAAWYSSQADQIRASLENFWDPNKGYFIANLNQTNMEYKTSGLDAAVVLGVLHGRSAEYYLPYSDARIWSTVDRLVEEFGRIYPVNQVAGRPGVAIGRYPEDKYAGNNFNGGNPWPLLTLALAELAYQSAIELAAKGNMKLAGERIAFGDEMILRVKLHAHADGSLNEQIDRDTGFMTSVEDLTWNYAALLTVARARAKATGN